MVDKRRHFDWNFNLLLGIFVLIVSILLFMIFSSFKDDESKIKKYQSSSLNFDYDNNFHLVDDSSGVELRDNDNSSIIVVKAFDYLDTYQKHNQNDLAESLSYQVIQNLDYEKIYEDIKNNKYYFLYENCQEKKQIETVIIFDNDYIFVIVYQANSDEFDLYSDSVAIIVESVKE